MKLNGAVLRMVAVVLPGISGDVRTRSARSQEFTGVQRVVVPGMSAVGVMG